MASFSNIKPSFPIDGTAFLNSGSQQPFHFWLNGANSALANAIRRYPFEEIKTYSFDADSISIEENETSIHNQFLIHRFEMLSFRQDIEDITNYEFWICNENKEAFEFVPANVPANVINENLFRAGQVYDRVFDITTDNLLIIHKETQSTIPNRSIFEVEQLITKIKPYEKLLLKAHVVQGVATEHAKFNPLAVLTYRELTNKDIQLQEKMNTYGQDDDGDYHYTDDDNVLDKEYPNQFQFSCEPLIGNGYSVYQLLQMTLSGLKSKIKTYLMEYQTKKRTYRKHVGIENYFYLDLKNENELLAHLITEYAVKDFREYFFKMSDTLQNEPDEVRKSRLNILHREFIAAYRKEHPLKPEITVHLRRPSFMYNQLTRDDLHHIQLDEISVSAWEQSSPEQRDEWSNRYMICIVFLRIVGDLESLEKSLEQHKDYFKSNELKLHSVTTMSESSANKINEILKSGMYSQYKTLVSRDLVDQEVSGISFPSKAMISGIQQKNPMNLKGGVYKLPTSAMKDTEFSSEEQFEDIVLTRDEKVIHLMKKHQQQLDELKNNLDNVKSLLDPIQADKNALTIKGMMDIFSSLKDRFTKSGNIVRGKISKEYNGELVSNAWLKLLEILTNYDKYIFAPNKDPNVMSFHFCEFPGSFVSAFNHYIKTKYPTKQWNWISQSYLPDDDKQVGENVDNVAPVLEPEEQGKSTKRTTGYLQDQYGFSQRYKDHWNFGTSAGLNGDVTDPNVIDYYNETYGSENIQLTTGDCGRSVQNYDMEEYEYMDITLGQFLSQISVLSKGGHMILKTFIGTSIWTASFYSMVSKIFEQFHIYKPVTSRPGNSEIYMIGLSFKLTPTKRNTFIRTYYEHLMVLRNASTVQKMEIAHTYSLDNDFDFDSLESYYTTIREFSLRQMKYIKQGNRVIEMYKDDVNAFKTLAKKAKFNDVAMKTYLELTGISKLEYKSKMIKKGKKKTP